MAKDPRTNNSGTDNSGTETSRSKTAGSKTSRISPSELKDPVVFLGLGLGSGLSPAAPGTMGTLITVPLVWYLQQQPFLVYALVTALVLVTGPWICGYSARKLGVHDHSAIVYDEVAGLLVTMLLAPAGWFWLILGFLLFRFFDIIKPWPISFLDRKIHGGLGIMLDDVIAGIFSLCCLLIIHISGLHDALP